MWFRAFSVLRDIEFKASSSPKEATSVLLPSYEMMGSLSIVVVFITEFLMRALAPLSPPLGKIHQDGDNHELRSFARIAALPLEGTMLSCSGG